MRQFLEGSQAVAGAVKLCRPGVISAYPITPQTHIVEGLAQMVADGELDSQFVNVESEHSAASVVLGASATGVRVYTATSSQGLLLMSEVIFNIAGMRLPIILTCANRALSAPISIWNDQQDVMAVRDSGWILIFAEDHQDLIDLHLQAFRIAEDHRIMLPVMVNMDGYILTHGMGIADVPTQEEVDEFLPPYKPLYKLDVNDPISLGCLAAPEHYQETRIAIQKTHEEALKIIPEVAGEFKKIFKRESGGLIETYKTEDAKQIIVSMGSVCGTIKDAVDELRDKGQKVGAVKVITYRPIPSDELIKVLEQAEAIAVLDKSISLGAYGPLFMDLKAIFQGRKKSPKISGFIAGLGGRDITKDSIFNILNRLSSEQLDCEFIDVKNELLKEKL
jgi:pyruvate ferredoxin oxidoreductase alpha subunit